MDGFDADVLIYASSLLHPARDRLRSLLRADEDPPESPVGIGSVLLIPELLIDATGITNRDLDAREQLLDRLDLFGVQARTARIAAMLRERYCLKTVAAVHLATAIEAGADRFITNNSKDFPKSITEIDITYPDDLPSPPG